MKKTIFSLFKIGPVIVGIFLIVWCFFIYPNDSRIAPFIKNQASIDKSSRRSTGIWSVKKRFFVDKIPYLLDIGDDSYLESLKRVEAHLPQQAQLNSLRFNHSRQLYLPVGLYPFRLDGRDGFFLPAGHSLVLTPGVSGVTRLEAGLWTPDSHATLYINRGENGERDIISYRRPDSMVEPDSFFYQTVEKWFHVDLIAGKNFHGWKDFTADIHLNEAAEIRFTCESPEHGCFVSEPTFLTEQKTPNRNFLVILVDTLRRDVLNSVQAPRMARLAKESANFVNAVSPGNMTSPSTNALLSCRLPTDLGSWAFSYGVSQEERSQFYKSARKSFPDTFSKNGYSTAMIGSVSLLSEIYGVGINHGFDRQIGIETDGLDTAQIARETEEWLAVNQSKQFFLYVHLNAPHAPYKAPWSDVFATWPGLQVFKSYASILRWLYTSEVHYTDRYVDSILKTLKKLDLSENTVVALVADHGDQMTTRRFRDNEAGPEFEGSYFDHGATLLDDEIGVPLVIHDPKIGEGRVITDRVSTIDLGPTLMGMADLTGAEGCFGKSLLPYLAGSNSVELRQRVLASESFQARAIIFENRYKYIRSYEPTQKRIHRPGGYFSEQSLYFTKEQIYDLDTDPFEEKNLFKGEMSLIARARTIYRKTFGVKEGFELVIESPEGRAIRGQFPSKSEIEVIYGKALISRDRNGFLLSSDGEKILILRTEDRDLGGSSLRIGGRPVDLKMTSLRLPLGSDLSFLPIEVGGEGSLIPFPREDTAYIRRIEDFGREERKIKITNPAFESVLREWGYLNDR